MNRIHLIKNIGELILTINSEQVTNIAERVVFLKLRKTGGTTLSASILFPHCIKHRLNFVRTRGSTLQTIDTDNEEYFHMMFRHCPNFRLPEIQRWLRRSIGNFKLITLVREPVSRLVSWYNHVYDGRKPESFETFMVKYHEANHQSSWLGFDGRDPEYLARNFSMIGTMERFNESMLLFRQTLKLSLAEMLYIKQRHNTEKKLTVDDLNQETIAKIKEIEWLDVKLYEQASKLLDSYVNNNPQVQKELPQYESALNDYSDPLWGEKGPFMVGYDMTRMLFGKFTGQGGEYVEFQN